METLWVNTPESTSSALLVSFELYWQFRGSHGNLETEVGISGAVELPLERSSNHQKVSALNIEGFAGENYVGVLGHHDVPLAVVFVGVGAGEVLALYHRVLSLLQLVLTPALQGGHLSPLSREGGGIEGPGLVWD